MEAEAGGEEDFWTCVITIEECEELNLKVGGEVRERRQVMWNVCISGEGFIKGWGRGKPRWQQRSVGKVNNVPSL